MKIIKILLVVMLFVLFTNTVIANRTTSYIVDLYSTTVFRNPINNKLEIGLMSTVNFEANQYDGTYTVLEWGEYEYDNTGVFSDLYSSVTPLRVYWGGQDCGCDGTYDFSQFFDFSGLSMFGKCDYDVINCNSDTYEICLDVVSTIDGYVGEDIDRDDKYFALHFQDKGKILKFNDILNKGLFKDECDTGFCWINLIHKIDNSELNSLYPEVCNNETLPPSPLPPDAGYNEENENGTSPDPNDDPNFPGEGGGRPDDNSLDKQLELEEVKLGVERTSTVFDGFLSFVAISFSFILLIFYVVSFLIIIYLFTVLIPDIFKKIRDLVRKSGKIK